MRLPRGGTEPANARSAYGLRAALAILALVGGLAGTAWFSLRVLESGRPMAGTIGMVAAGVLCLAVAGTAAADLVILWRRTRRSSRQRGSEQNAFHK